MREDFEARFVSTGDIIQRSSIYAGWNAHRTALIDAGLPAGAHQLLDGSYTTAKDSPGDIDIAVEVPVSSGDSLRTVTTDDPIPSLCRAQP